MKTMRELTCTVCSKTFTRSVSDIKRGRTKYCSKNCSSGGGNNPAYKHGNSRRKEGQTKVYRTWAQIKTRCLNPKASNYKYYGGRGITMCDRWVSSSTAFLKDMGKAPSEKHSIERLDHEKGYEPGNCVWATHLEQMNNTRRNVFLTVGEQTLTYSQWSKETGVKANTIRARIHRGWPPEKAVK